jgi:SAM-dependent methyltransferase
MVGSMQLTSISAHITQDIAPVPLLWVVPLALYLATFIIAFSGINIYKRPLVLRIEIILLASIGYVLSRTDVNLPMTERLLFFLAELFVSCLICHSELSRRKPSNEDSGDFYVLVAAGSAFGSFLIAIVSPLIFRANYDVAITFLFTSLLATLITWRDGHTQRLLWTTSSLLLGYLCLMLGLAQHRTTFVGSRSFYGALRVTNNYNSADKGTLRVLQNGSIQHGAQFLSQPWRRMPITYYSSRSGLGLALNAHYKGEPRNIAVIGLGTGTIAAYGRKGDSFQFFEINPQVVSIAKDQFSYIADSPANIQITLGDGRGVLSNEVEAKFDVIVVDAFNSDSIPTHLLTAQAFELYRQHLARNGLLVFHVSNRYLELGAQVNLLSAFIGFEAREIDSAADTSQGIYAAKWVLASTDTGFFAKPEILMSAQSIPTTTSPRLWTDDYSSLLPFIRVLRR